MAVVLSVCLIGLALSFSVFGLNPPSSFQVDLYAVYQNYDQLDENLYSVTRVSGSSNSLITSGTNQTSSGSHIFQFGVPFSRSGFVPSVPYHVQFSVQSSSYNSVDTYINYYFLMFFDSQFNLIDSSPVVSYVHDITDFGYTESNVTFSFFDYSFYIPAETSYIALTFCTSCSNNRSRLKVSPLSFEVVNSADFGGSFSEDQPDIPDVDIDTYLDDFGDVTPDAINTLVNGFGQVSGSVQATAMFFSKVWTDLTTAAPEIMYVIYFGLSFGVIALILNIYSFAKGQGRSTGQASSTGRHKGGSPK